MEYYLGMKRNEVLRHGVIWMNLKKIMLSKRRQAQKDTYCMILLYDKPQIGNL